LKRICSRPAVIKPLKYLVAGLGPKRLSRLPLVAAVLAVLALPLLGEAGLPVADNSGLIALSCYLAPLGPQYQTRGTQSQPQRPDLAKEWHGWEPLFPSWPVNAAAPAGLGIRAIADCGAGGTSRRVSALAERAPPGL